MAFSSKLLIAAIASTALLGTTALVNANVMSYTTTITTHGNPSTFAAALTQYNPAILGGTLTSATITFSLTLHPDVTEVNLSGPQDVPFVVTLNALTFNLLDPYAVTSSQSYDFTGNPLYSAAGVTQAPSHTNIQSFPLPDIAFASTTHVPTANLANYTGTSTFSPSFSDSTTGSTSITPGGGAAGRSLTFDGTATVTYVFTPEPASLSLLALGGAALLTRRRRSN